MNRRIFLWVKVDGLKILKSKSRRSKSAEVDDLKIFGSATKMNVFQNYCHLFRPRSFIPLDRPVFVPWTDRFHSLRPSFIPSHNPDFPFGPSTVIPLDYPVSSPHGPSTLTHDRPLWTWPDDDMKRFETVDTNMNFIHNFHPMFWFCSSSGLKKLFMFCSVLCSRPTIIFVFCSVLCSAEQNRTLLF